MLVAERYRLSGPLGRGGMGEVHRATDEVLAREVAVKLLLPSRQDPVTTERFRREARAAAMLSDPHVVATYDFGRHDGGWFLVMELVEGRTVAEELRQCGPLTAERATDIVRQAAAGLAAAHRHDIVHRDIKPGNLLLTPDGTVKVADFGIARFLDDTTTTLTATGQVLGTSYYLAPERAEGRPAGKPSDVYALGCVLYQLVTGHPPFQADQPAGVMYQHVSTAPTPPSHLRPQLAGPFEDLLLSMLAKDPAQRPTAEDVAAGTAPHPIVAGELLDKNEATTVEVRALVPWRRRIVAVAAAVTVAAAASTAVLLETRGTQLPETAELAPSHRPAPTPSKTVPVPTPSFIKSKPTPTPAEQVTETTQRQSAKPTAEAQEEPERKAERGKAADQDDADGKGNQGKKDKGKSKKP